MRLIALGRKNSSWARRVGGGAAAIAYTLIETSRLNDIDPQAWLAHILERIPATRSITSTSSSRERAAPAADPEAGS